MLVASPRESWFFYTLYATGITVIPALVRVVSGAALTPFHRIYLSLGLALHPYSMYRVIYRDIWWWDILTHFVSATLLASGCYIALYALRRATDHALLARQWPHVWAFVTVFVLGVVWEVYEIYVPWLTNYGTVDSIKDVMVDLLGWATVSFVAPRVFGALPALREEG